MNEPWRFSGVLRVLGILLMIFSISMLPPIFVSFWYHDQAVWSFIVGFFVTLLTGAAIWLPYREHFAELKTRDGFLIVVLFWTVLSSFGAIPLIVDADTHMSFTNALFESVSGLTTTGATVVTHVGKLPHAILYYRQQLHLLGGMGIIVLAVAILPMLGIGGMQLYRAETVGPIKTNKLKPRITETAKALWYIYGGLVLICALLYWLAGMQPFDALGESFSTISTGGFSTHDSSFAFYHSSLIDGIAVIFMLLGATNFGLHFHFIKTRKISTYFRDPEFRFYLIMLGTIIFITLITLLTYHKYHHVRTLLDTIFSVVSISTTTGLTTTNFSIWPLFLPYLLMFVAIMGGCGASTSGGLKIMRCMLLKEQGRRELKRLVHPQGVFAVKLGDITLSDSVTQAIWGFMAVFIALFIILLLLLLATGLDLTTAFGALAACISNTGAAIGKVANNFDHIPIFSKWILIFAMIAGRLEIFTLLVIFTPDYWRK